MSSKVWLVTEGEYSDYHVVRAFSSEERAKSWVGEATSLYGIEETTLDDDSNRAVLGLEVWMCLDGSTPRWSDGCEVKDVAREDLESVDVVLWPNDDQISAAFDHADRSRAIKALNEIRAQVLALGRQGSIPDGKRGIKRTLHRRTLVVLKEEAW